MHKQFELPNYQPISLRGSGSFGCVIEAYDKNKDRRVAIKRTQKVSKTFSREIEVLEALRDCDQVVQMLDIFYTINKDGNVVQNIVFEYLPKSLITDYGKKQEHLPFINIQSIMYQILTGLKYIHSKNIVHRDLKPENILLTDDQKVKICDFGSSKFIYGNTKSNPFIVSRFYRAPELILGSTFYNEKIDLFSAGCIFAELFLKEPLFPGKSEGLQLFEYICILGRPTLSYYKKFNYPEEYVAQIESLTDFAPVDIGTLLNKKNFYSERQILMATELIKKMLTWDPNERISAAQALQHQFFLEDA